MAQSTADTTGFEVGAGHRSEQQDEHAEPEHGGEGVLQQLHADVGPAFRS
jgi:hypothetical protein